ncbi:MAG: radical SAM family heme chaperone HemW [Chloroflexota bacterium]
MSLYLHIPFCRHRCSYCDFNTYTTLGALQDEYTAALCQEIRQVAGDERRPAHTVFFGGGTPSLLSIANLRQILWCLNENFDLATNTEITLEANPGTVDSAYLAALRDLGVNRLSFGAQSAVASELALLEREHDFAAVVEAVAMSRAAGFDNLNLDFIYGVPGQTLDSWRYSLETALALQMEHLSLYCLTIEPGTPMQRWLRDGRISLPDPDLAADQYELACALLGSQAAYTHYEISNWARPGRQCEHNLTYWRNREYLGLGAGAHGHAAGYRYQVVRQPRVYIRRLQNGVTGQYPWSAAVAEKHAVDQGEAMSDTVITQLRLLQEGLDLAAFSGRFGQTLHDAYGPTVSQLVEWGLLHEKEGWLLLTRRGYFLSNQVFYRFMSA